MASASLFNRQDRPSQTKSVANCSDLRSQISDLLLLNCCQITACLLVCVWEFNTFRQLLRLQTSFNCSPASYSQPDPSARPPARKSKTSFAWVGPLNAPLLSAPTVLITMKDHLVGQLTTLFLVSVSVSESL